MEDFYPILGSQGKPGNGLPTRLKRSAEIEKNKDVFARRKAFFYRLISSITSLP
jgi:hypothetical protein